MSSQRKVTELMLKARPTRTMVATMAEVAGRVTVAQTTAVAGDDYSDGGR